MKRTHPTPQHTCTSQKKSEKKFVQLNLQRKKACTVDLYKFDILVHVQNKSYATCTPDPCTDKKFAQLKSTVQTFLHVQGFLLVHMNFNCTKKVLVNCPPKCDRDV